MSKAFTKESDTGSESDAEVIDEYQPPPGGKNYLTPTGYAALRAELEALQTVKRPQLVQAVAQTLSSNGVLGSTSRELKSVERRIRYLNRCLHIAEVINVSNTRIDEVRFGLHVLVQDEDGNQQSYQIVGIEEVNIAEKKISWISPLATALLAGKIGDTVVFASPKGEREIEIVEISQVSFS